MRAARLLPLLLPLAAISPRPVSPAAVAASPIVVPFIADDYARAVAEARARKVPLFIEAWAPW